MIELDKVREELGRMGIDSSLYDELVIQALNDPTLYNAINLWRVGDVTYASAMTTAAVYLSAERVMLIKQLSDLRALQPFSTTIQVKT